MHWISQRRQTRQNRCHVKVMHRGLNQDRDPRAALTPATVCNNNITATINNHN